MQVNIRSAHLGFRPGLPGAPGGAYPACVPACLHPSASAAADTSAAVPGHQSPCTPTQTPLGSDVLHSIFCGVVVLDLGLNVPLPCALTHTLANCKLEQQHTPWSCSHAPTQAILMPL